jgi:outer membrane protein TolC
MKVLHLWVTLLAVSSSLFSQEAISLDSYISENKKDIFSYDYKKNEEEGLILRDSWISPIILNYSYSKSNPFEQVQTNQAAAIKMDQAIFRGGGIFYSVKFANASKKYSDYSVDVAKRKMIKDTISILMQIKQTDLKIAKQELQIKNADINLELKKEQYLSGQLDSGFLDNAIIERNAAIAALYDIQTSQERLISSFQTLSDLDYNTAKIPHLELIDEEEFLKYNISLDMANIQVERDEHNKGVTRAKYLPVISVTAGYNWTKTDATVAVFGSPERDNYDYGIKATMPLDINTFRDIESAKVDYLKSELLAQDKEKELKALFEQVIQNIDNFEKKITLSLENMDIYTKLLMDTRELFKAGYKTQYDVETLENSVNISIKDSKILELDKQIELLNLYEMYVND